MLRVRLVLHLLDTAFADAAASWLTVAIEPALIRVTVSTCPGNSIMACSKSNIVNAGMEMHIDYTHACIYIDLLRLVIASF